MRPLHYKPLPNITGEWWLKTIKVEQQRDKFGTSELIRESYIIKTKKLLPERSSFF
jgi:hypothetical protein